MQKSTIFCIESAIFLSQKATGWDFETTDGEGTHLLSELLELVVWSEVQDDKEKEKELVWLLFDKLLVEPGLRFV